MAAACPRLSKAIISFLPQSAADWELFEVFHRAIVIESSGQREWLRRVHNTLVPNDALRVLACPYLIE